MRRFLLLGGKGDPVERLAFTIFNSRKALRQATWPGEQIHDVIACPHDALRMIPGYPVYPAGATMQAELIV